MLNPCTGCDNMEVWRTQLTFDVTDHRALSWFENPYRIHQRLLMAWPNEPPGRVLWRADAEWLRLLVQAPNKADWLAAFRDFPILIRASQSQTALELAPGEERAFQLRAAPTKTRIQPGERSKILYGLPEPEWIPWLERKSDLYGFELVKVRTKGSTKIEPRRNRDEPPHTHFAVDFEGVLRVTDPESFARAVVGGIGRGKGYGLGLLILE